jgi:TPR repeat protein
MKQMTFAGILCVLGFCCSAPLMAVNRAEPSVRATSSAARKGDAAAQLKLGEMFDLGEGVPQDYEEAAKWYRLSAEQGNPVARFALAEMYKNGDGVPKDIQAAIKWVRLAAEQDYALAWLLLDVLYESGTGVKASAGEAARWYRLAANGDNAHAQLLIANLYNAGQGVARDPVAAYALYTVSAEREPRGNPATSHRTEWARGMSAAEIERASLLAREMTKPGKLLKALDRHLKTPG